MISVTQILKYMFPKKYAGVPKKTLQKAADRGNAIHEAIENYAMNHDDESFYGLVMNGLNYDLLEEDNKIIVTSCEQPLIYMDGDAPLYAGTYDLHGTIDNMPAIIDIKATSKLDDEYLIWQLTLYALAYEQMYSQKIQRLGALWYPSNKKGQFKEYYRFGESVALEEVRKIVKKHHGEK